MAFLVPLIMTRARMFILGIVVPVLACAEGRTAPTALAGTYTLVAENDQSLPSDPGAPYGCCLTLGGSVTFTAGTYDLRRSHRNKVNGTTFDNAEQGTYIRQGNTLHFTRTGGGSAGYPYLLGNGTVTAANMEVMLPYGHEGPGSNQIRATFRR